MHGVDSIDEAGHRRPTNARGSEIDDPFSVLPGCIPVHGVVEGGSRVKDTVDGIEVRNEAVDPVSHNVGNAILEPLEARAIYAVPHEGHDLEVIVYEKTFAQVNPDVPRTQNCDANAILVHASTIVVTNLVLGARPLTLKISAFRSVSAGLTDAISARVRIRKRREAPVRN